MRTNNVKQATSGTSSATSKPGSVITVTVNGETREAAHGGTIEDLLDSLGLHPRLVVVEHNREIVDRARYADIEVHDGDGLEVVHFVGGG